MWDLFLFSFSLAHRKNSRFRALRRSCEIGRAGNANFATAGSAGKKRQKRKGPETAPWPVSITRLLWLRQWRTLFLAEDVLSVSLPLTVLLSCSRRSATASETAQREHCRSRLNGFLASRSTPLSPRFPHSSLPFFYSSSSVFLSSSLPPFRSSRRANLLGRYVQIDSGRVRGPCSRVPCYLILPRFRNLICIPAARLFCFNVKRTLNLKFFANNLFCTFHVS